MRPLASVAGMRCTAINEGLEPPETTWTDNYLCVPSNSPLQLSWSMGGPLFGKSCVRFHEPVDPHGWSDNYLCANKDMGMRWSVGGPIDGMRCTRIHEDAEPASTTWSDNHLCVPPAADVQLSWSQGGPLPGLTCVLVDEPEDPQPWEDNYLCH